MTNGCVRPLLGAVVAGLVAMIPVVVATQDPAPAPAWNVGDVFAGVGRFEKHPGKYVVLDAIGTPTGQVLEDPFAGLTGTTTGCAIDFDASGEALFATTFANRRLTRFGAVAAPHTASTAFVFDETGMALSGAVHDNLGAVESIVFDGDADGFYYVGGQWPVADSAADYENRRGYIFKFNRQHELVDSYEVPADDSGVDWLDLGSDKTTIYYTSELGIINVYETATPYDSDQPFGGRHSAILVTDGGTQIGSRAQALRLLPPDPDDPALEPSGFLVTTSDNGVFRLNASGEKIAEYRAPGLTGSYFGLNLTPDGQSFWTATYQVYPDWADYCPGGKEYYDGDLAWWEPEYCVLYNPDTGEMDLPPPAPEGKIVRFHIASGAMTAGPISIQLYGQPVDNVWGLCVKREYTAASNACYQLNADGTAVLDTDGQPISIPCRVPVFCPNDPTHPDCVDPGAPRLFLPDDQTDTEGDTITPLQLVATHPEGKTMTFVVTRLPPDLSATPDGLITGTLSYLSAHGIPYVVHVAAHDGPIGAPGTQTISGTFLWHVVGKNGPPFVLAPSPLTVPIGLAIEPIHFTTGDPDVDGLQVTVSGLPPGLTAPGTVVHPYAFALTGTPTHGGVYEVTVCVTDTYRETPASPIRDSVCASVVITVTNLAPELVLPDRTHLVGEFLTVAIEAWDPDGHDPLTFAASGLPSGLSIDAATGVVSGTPGVVGRSSVTVTVTDGFGASTVGTFTWSIITNRPPVCTGARPSQALWPPNHKFVPIDILGVTDPDGDPITIAITGIQQDEPVLTPGSGNTDADGRIDGATAYVRAERAGGGDGRVYEIFFTASDGVATCAGSVLVGIPHDQGKPGQRFPVDSGVRYNSLTGAVIIGPSGASGPPGRHR